MAIITRELQKRLRKLESKRPRRQPELTEQEKTLKYAKDLLWFAIAQYLGDPNPREAPMVAFARALQYEPLEILEVLEGIESRHNDSFDKKYALAIRRLFSKFGVNFDKAKNGERVEALKRMDACLSEDYRDRLINTWRDRSFD
jgi:hypothetical protein